MFNPAQTIKRKFYAPAKINLSLAITGRYSNGYHALESLIAPISLFDEVELEVSKISLGKGRVSVKTEFESDLLEHLKFSGEFQKIDSELNSENNLCSRAAKLSLKMLGIREDSLKIEIKLKKSIPIGAGLGGGSSDAAAVIRGIFSLLAKDNESSPKFNLSKSILELGSDVQACIFHKPVFVSSAGELVKELKPESSLEILKKSCGIVLLKPRLNIGAKEAYQLYSEEMSPPLISEQSNAFSPRSLDFLDTHNLEIDETVNLSIPTLNNLTFYNPNGSSGGLKSSVKPPSKLEFFNDFQDHISRNYAEVGHCIDLLKSHGANQVLLAGSGSTVLGFTEDLGQAESLVVKLKSSSDSSFFIKAAEMV